ncbi:MAG: T9SS type A sorting domain-containing protein [Bacteroidales bacterium]|nr:T9SS type A sorting domain-containing protein [Bacteroidales bacterium]MDD4672207.1 T9SS type A sorting domain-containing protein [Bacteroidales bacterium]
MKLKNIKSKLGLLLLAGMLLSTAAFAQNGEVVKGDVMFDHFNVFYKNLRGEQTELRSLKDIDNLPQGTMLYYHRKSNDDIIFTTKRRATIFTPGKDFSKKAKHNAEKSTGGIIWKEAEMNQKIGLVSEAIYESPSSYTPMWDSLLIAGEHENISARTNGEYTYPQAKQYPAYDCGPWKWSDVLLDSMEVYTFYFDDFSIDNLDDAIDYALLQTIENGMNEQTPIMAFSTHITSESPDAYTKAYGISHQAFDEEGNFLPDESMSYFLIQQDSKTLPAGHDAEDFLGLKFSISVVDGDDGTVHKRFGRDLLGTFDSDGSNDWYTGPGAFIGTELMEPLNEPVNISANPSTATISWNTPAGDVIGYTIYNEATKVAENIVDTEYQLSNLVPIRPYNIKVCSEYATGNSLPANVSFDYTPPVEYPTPNNLHVDETSYLLTWVKPEFETWISYNDDQFDYTIGPGGAVDAEAAIRFYPTQTSRYDGYFIRAIKFVPGESDCEHSIRIWDDEAGNNLVYDQVITENLTNDEWNEIMLSTPYQIDGSKNLWIGIRANTQSGYPFYYDLSNCIAPGRADLIRVVGASEWDILYEQEYKRDINWCIAALIDVNGDDGQSAVTDYTISLNEDILSNNAPGFEYLLVDHLTANTNYTAGVAGNYQGGSSETVTFDFTHTPNSIDDYSATSNFLDQNFPNPVNNTTNINYSIDEGYHGVVNISVYNILGQKLIELVNSKHTGGSYSVELDASSFKSGVYIYSLEVGEQSFSKMMIVR